MTQDAAAQSGCEQLTSPTAADQLDGGDPTEHPQSTEKTSAQSAKEAQREAAKARQAAALKRMRAQQAEFAQREPPLLHAQPHAHEAKALSPFRL